MTEGMTSGAKNRTDVPHIEHRLGTELQKDEAEKGGEMVIIHWTVFQITKYLERIKRGKAEDIGCSSFW